MRLFLLAQKINRIAGGAVITPWEVEQLPDDWLDVAMAFDQIPNMKQGFDRLEAKKAEWRKNHEGYNYGR